MVGQPLKSTPHDHTCCHGIENTKYVLGSKCTDYIVLRSIAIGKGFMAE